MAAATNTTGGQVLMTGDFSVTSTGSSPELRPTGITPATYTNSSLVIDAKGRVIYAQEIPDEVIVGAFNASPDATTSSLGKFKLSSDFIVSSGEMSVPYASTSTFGIMKVGSNMMLDENNNLQVTAPAATTTSYGLVQPGSNFYVDGAGVLQNTNFWDATSTSKGMVSISPDANSGLAVSNGTVYARDASSTVTGVVRISSDLVANDGYASVPTVAGSAFGLFGIADTDSGLSVTDGVLNFNSDTSSIPVATTSVLGRVKVGSGLAITGDGLLSIQDATTSTKGIVQIGSGLSVSSGILSVPTATTSTKGLVQVGTGLSVSSGLINAKLASNTEFGVVTTPNSVSSGLELSNGLLSFHASIPKKHSNNLFTSSVVVSPFATSENTTYYPDMSLSNVFTMQMLNSGTLKTPTNTNPGQVSLFLITAVNGGTFYFDSTSFSLNDDSTFILQQGQILSFSMITVSSNKHIILISGAY